MSANPTAKDIAVAFVSAVHALAEAIRDLRTVPSGHLYANVMGHLDFPTYERLIASLVSTGLVEKRGDLLIWKGAAE